MAGSIVVNDMPHMVEARSVEDDWAGISDFGARKKRQNRLNQRALRRRKAANKSANCQIEPVEPARLSRPPIVECQADSVSHSSSHAENCDGYAAWTPGKQIISKHTVQQPKDLVKQFSPLNVPHGNAALQLRWSSSPESFVLVVSAGPTTIVLDLYALPLPADHLLTLVRYNLYKACAANAEILGLEPRALHDDITSPFCNPRTFNHPLPDSLAPTETQTTVLHHPYIDIFPFASLRDKLILLQGTFSEDELCADLGGKNSTTEHTGLIVWGDSWDPMAWEVSEYIAIKWSWLLDSCEELRVATNFWRNTRGEAPLRDALLSH
ncbi:hypothetical protein F5Y12DRAFT_757233 [Xylaria sp. FL1777]|nr:hypothetical protein F5Y12DRAFT_757233 [Xylaria sp. FL1777]